MNYGNPKAAGGGAAVLALTGFTLGEQLIIILSGVIFIVALAMLLRKMWRRGKQLGDK